MKKIDITVENRDLFYTANKHLWFEQVEDNVYTLQSDESYILEYACVNYDELPADSTDYDFVSTDQFGVTHKGRMCSFDPSGGPYMSVGNYTIDGKILTRIYEKNGKTYFEVAE